MCIVCIKNIFQERKNGHQLGIEPYNTLVLILLSTWLPWAFIFCSNTKNRRAVPYSSELFSIQRNKRTSLPAYIKTSMLSSSYLKYPFRSKKRKVCPLITVANHWEYQEKVLFISQFAYLRVKRCKVLYFFKKLQYLIMF